MDRVRVALVVEDDPDIQDAVSTELTRMGFSVLQAMHYEAALQQLAGAELDVACIDLELPTESGYEVCEYIRRTLGSNVPILVTSDWGFPEHMAYAEKAGANAFLKKPFSVKELGHYVEALIQNRKRSEPRMRQLRP